MWELWGVARTARNLNPDLLHIPHFSAPLRPGFPLVVTVHDVIPFVLPEYRASKAMRAHLAVMRRTIRNAAIILTPSQAAADDIERILRIPATKIRITPEAAGAEYVPSADDTPVHAVRDRYGLRGRYVFNVGGLDTRKNLPALIEAMALIRPRLNDPVALVIAGASHSGNPLVFPPLEPVIQKFDMTESVVLPGRITETEKIALYQGASLYVTPSSHEGFGLTALEAMACGAPVIAANRTSLPEVVGDAGLLVDPVPAALANAILSVLDNQDLAARLSRRGQDRAATFTWRRTAELTIEAYREALERSTAERTHPNHG
jgi:glycosyltransferase involved in cell wall biosynthesis